MVQYQKGRGCFPLVFLWWVYIYHLISGSTVLITIETGFWAASLVYLILQWRAGKLGAPRDPPFRPPQEHIDLEEGEEEEGYTSIPPIRQSSANASSPINQYDPPSNVNANPFADSNQYSAPLSSSGYTPASNNHQPLAGRPSMDAYGAFSDPAPTGFGTASPNYSSAYGTASPARTATSGAPIIPEPDLGPRVSRTMQYADPYAAVRASVAGQTTPSSPPSYENYAGYR